MPSTASATLNDTRADSGHQRAQAEPCWARTALAVLLIATAASWCLGLSRNGWANTFYSAAVQAGTKSWKAALFGSSDAANSITVDKPPAALWPMEISARIFGVNTWSIQLPQVLLGVASVALLYSIVRRSFGVGAGLITGAVLAVTPVATLMFRYNNPDALLVFLMIAAVWALLRAVEDGRTRWLVLCGTLIGLGFLTKQLQVMLVVPALALTYGIAGPVGLGKRFGQLMAALAAMIVSAGWWVALVELTPAQDRPYIGGSPTNSFLELTFGYNGLGRIMGSDSNTPTGAPPRAPDSMTGPSSPFEQAGITRMFTGESAGQISWLLPAALIFLIIGLVVRGRAVRTDHRRAHYLVWGGWLLGTGLVFSLMSGLFHDYYTVALAPAVAALVGMGAATLWRLRDTSWIAVTSVATVAVTTVWAWYLLGRTADFVPWLRWLIFGGGVSAAIGFIIAAALPAVSSHTRDVRVWAAAVAVVVALAGPLSYSVQTLTTSHTGGIVTAGPSIDDEHMPGAASPPSNSAAARPAGTPAGAPGMHQTEAPDGVVQMLLQNAGSYTWVAATNGSTDAGVYQLATDMPVMALGGFGSGDPSPTLEQFQQYVADGRLHFYIQSAGPGLGSSAADSDSDAAAPISSADGREATRISDWVEQQYSSVTVDGVTLYDLTSG